MLLRSTHPVASSWLAHMPNGAAQAADGRGLCRLPLHMGTH